jgi:hypothetical protein
LQFGQHLVYVLAADPRIDVKGVCEANDYRVNLRLAIAALPNETSGRIKPMKYASFTVQYYRLAIDSSAHEIQTTLRVPISQF